MEENFSQRLSNLIKQRGLTLSEVSKGSGVSKSQVHNYLQGSEPSLTKLVQLSRFFDVTIDYLVSGRESSSGDPVVEVIQAEIRSKGLYEIVIRKKNVEIEEE